MFFDYLKTIPQYLVPQHGLSRLFGKLAAIQQATIKNWGISQFIRHYGVNMAEARQTNPQAYSDFNSFFIRQLKPELRPITTETNTLACPIDGTISQIGTIQQGRILQAKGVNFSVDELLGGNQQGRFQQGYFATLYLSPKDYHRIHMPLTGTLQSMTYIPGKLFSVQPSTVRTVKCLFSRNERVVTLFDTELGPLAVILVGAMIVASIHTRWHGTVAPQRSHAIQQWNYASEQQITLQRGEEMGYFTLGSTVILLLDSNKTAQWDPSIKIDSTVKYGQALIKCQY